MGSKSDADKAYDDGYRDGKKGNFVDDFLQYNVGVDGKHKGSYKGGYKDGHSDRYNDDNDNYQGGNYEGSGGGGSSSGGCFVTTATLNSIGKSDDCAELRVFRDYRDHWLAMRPDGKQLITEYYTIAPKIVAEIDSQPNAYEIYHGLWENNIKPCLNLIKSKHYVQARTFYVNTIIELKEKYLNQY